MLSWFMIGSYAYYALGDRVMKDTDFDYLVEKIKESWSEIDHPHKKLISINHLEAATGYDIKFPTIVKMTTNDYLKRTK